MTKKHAMKFLTLMMFALLVMTSSSSVFVSGSVGSGSDISTDAGSILVLTRHDTNIQVLYENAFLASDYAVEAGITDVKYQSPANYEGFVNFITSTSLRPSLAWGGGPALFDSLANNGYIDAITDTEILDYVAANISDSLAGASMKRTTANGLEWVAAAISSFGFTVNHDTLNDRGLDVPTTWEDLASPEFFTTISEVNIGMGNAPDTTSNTRIYQIILQKFGWEKGWEIIYRMAGNSGIYPGSGETKNSVINGETAVAMTIDFYGLGAQEENPSTEYIIPTNGSIVNGDPIAITDNPGNLAGANAFIKFVLSPEGQALWTNKDLLRLPVREIGFETAYANAGSQATRDTITKLYDVYNKTLANQGIEFDEDLALSFEEAMRYHFQATITNAHSKLRTTWSEIAINAKEGAFVSQRFDQLAAIFGEPAMTQSQAQSINSQIISDSSFRTAKMTEWTDFAIDKYDAASEEVPKEYTYVTVIDGKTTTITTTPNLADLGYDDAPFAFSFGIIALLSSVMIIRTLRHKRRK